MYHSFTSWTSRTETHVLGGFLSWPLFWQLTNRSGIMQTEENLNLNKEHFLNDAWYTLHIHAMTDSLLLLFLPRSLEIMWGCFAVYWTLYSSVEAFWVFSFKHPTKNCHFVLSLEFTRPLVLRYSYLQDALWLFDIDSCNIMKQIVFYCRTYN